MKRFIVGFALFIFLIPLSVTAFSQNVDTLTLLEAMDVATADTDAIVLEADYDADNACWKFEFDDGTEVCISDTTGEVVDTSDDSPDAESTDEAPAPEATEEASESSEGSTSEASEGSESSDEPLPVEDTVVTIEEAIALALEIFPNSVVTNINLEIEDGVLQWDIELDGGIRSVDVDAVDGSVLGFGYESDDEASESSEASSASSGDNSNSSNQSNESSEASEPSEPSEPSERSENSEGSD